MKVIAAPPFLKKGDKVAITCPAKKLFGPVDDAVRLLESWGLEVVLGETVFAAHHQYAGPDDLRCRDLQRFLDDPSIKAVFAARGGYGTIRIIDAINFRQFQLAPKWVIGFSDVTVLHSHIHEVCSIQTVHGQMPLNVPDGTKPSLESLRKALFGEPLQYEFETHLKSRLGNAHAPLIGGNLTLLVMMSQSASEQDFAGKILFIEDVGEYLYSIDRMMWQLRRAGKLALLKGLVVGGFSDLKDSEPAFGTNVEELILAHVQAYQYPVCFGFPAGHITDNHALILGKTVTLTINPTISRLSF